jgi:hypothetical protein
MIVTHKVKNDDEIILTGSNCISDLEASLSQRSDEDINLSLSP